MSADRMQELGAGLGLQRGCAAFDESQSEVHVAEELSLCGLGEHGPGEELEGPPDVMQDRRSEQEVGAEPRMELGRLAADRRHADRVLEQAACIAVMALRRGGQRSEQPPQLAVVEES